MYRIPRIAAVDKIHQEMLNLTTYQVRSNPTPFAIALKISL